MPAGVARYNGPMWWLAVVLATAMAAGPCDSVDVGTERPDLARMHSTTTARIERATSRTELTARTVTTAQHLAVEVAISVDGQPFWHKTWTRGLGD